MNNFYRDEMNRQYMDAFGDVEDAWDNRYDDRTVYPEENGEHGDGLTPEELAEHLAFPAPWEDKNERDDGNDAADLNAERSDYLEWSAEWDARQTARDDKR